MGRLIRGISKNARFFVADTTDVIQEALDIHKYDEYSMKIFGKFCTLASLMGATLKGEDKLTIRTDTDGYIKNIVVTENFDGLGKGTMRIIKDMGLKEPYVAISNIDYSNLPNDISEFFYNSEQIPTVISLAVECTNDGKILCAGAFMVQLLPNADEDFITKLERKGNSERFQKGIMTLGKEELKHIFEEEKEIEAQCQFCGKKYKFTEKDFDDVLKK